MKYFLATLLCGVFSMALCGFVFAGPFGAMFFALFGTGPLLLTSVMVGLYFENEMKKHNNV